MTSEPGTQLYLVAEADAGEATLARFDAAMKVDRVSSVLIVPRPGAAFDAEAAAKLIERAQTAGIAGLVAGSAADAARTGADGVHVAWSDSAVTSFTAMREALGDGSIVGVDAGRSRHDAMTLGEGGADYIAFGIPAHVQDREKASSRRLELIFWWSEIFEIPCVAFDVSNEGEARELAAAGADFIAVTLPATCTPAEAREHIQSFSDAISASLPAMA